MQASRLCQDQEDPQAHPGLQATPAGQLHGVQAVPCPLLHPCQVVQRAELPGPHLREDQGEPEGAEAAEEDEADEAGITSWRTGAK